MVSRHVDAMSMTTDPDDFGGDPPAPPDNVIPFTRMRLDERIAKAWIDERAAVNQRESKAYRYPNPIDALDDLVRQQALPALPWPVGWPELGKRGVLYQGQILGIAGPGGGGKSSFAIQMAIAACAAGVPVLWMPLELTNAEIDLRIVANMARTHTAAVRGWKRVSIERHLIAIADRWRYIDRWPGDGSVEAQLAAIATGVRLCKRIYRKAPFVVVDYLGKLARRAKDPRLVLADAVDWFMRLCEAEECWVALLSQTSRGNTAMLTGKVDLESAADAIGVSAETGELEHAASVNLALNVFKADDADALSAHVLVTKARNTGREGRQGFEFAKPGGVWSELDYLPPTPNEVAAEVRRTTKKGQAAPEAATTRGDLSQRRISDAEKIRARLICGALGRAGLIGLTAREIRRVPGVGKTDRIKGTLLDLVRAGDVEEHMGKWRLARRGSGDD